MSLHGGTVDHGERISGFRRVTLKHTLPDPARGPTVEAITGRRIRAIFLRQIAPGNASTKDVENRIDDASIINPCRPPSRGNERFQGLPFFIRKIVAHANFRGGRITLMALYQECFWVQTLESFRSARAIDYYGGGPNPRKIV
jgi:hypothetical protein